MCKQSDRKAAYRTVVISERMNSTGFRLYLRTQGDRRNRSDEATLLHVIYCMVLTTSTSRIAGRTYTSRMICVRHKLLARGLQSVCHHGVQVSGAFRHAVCGRRVEAAVAHVVCVVYKDLAITGHNLADKLWVPITVPCSRARGLKIKCGSNFLQRIRDVFWLGPPAPKVPGSDSKNTSQIQMLRHFEKTHCKLRHEFQIIT